MARRLGYADKALADLVAIRRWLTQPGSGPAARQRVRAIRAAINRLRAHPCFNPVGERPGVRELQCDGGYRVLYEVDPDTGTSATAGDVVILRVYGPGQDRRGFAHVNQFLQRRGPGGGN